MTNILKGKPVADKINEHTIKIINNLSFVPTISIIRCGNNPDDISYEKAILKKCSDFNIKNNTTILDEKISKKEYINTINKYNNDPNTHGIILLNQLYKEYSSTIIDPQKDIDGFNPINISASFLNKKNGFIPCTAQAVIELLDYYKIDIQSKNITIIGRSMTVGKPLSMLLLNRNATITVCHSHTDNLKKHTLNSDIVISCIGQAELFDHTYFKEGQTVIDVGINYSEIKKKICGDILFDDVKDVVENITPVPFGIGSITNSVLLNHLALATERLQNEN